jgi:hypothetical protein
VGKWPCQLQQRRTVLANCLIAGGGQGCKRPCLQIGNKYFVSKLSFALMCLQNPSGRRQVCCRKEQIWLLGAFPSKACWWLWNRLTGTKFRLEETEVTLWYFECCSAQTGTEIFGSGQFWMSINLMILGRINFGGNFLKLVFWPGFECGWIWWFWEKWIRFEIFWRYFLAVRVRRRRWVVGSGTGWSSDSRTAGKHGKSWSIDSVLLWSFRMHASLYSGDFFKTALRRN